MWHGSQSGRSAAQRCSRRRGGVATLHRGSRIGVRGRMGVQGRPNTSGVTMARAASVKCRVRESRAVFRTSNARSPPPTPGSCESRWSAPRSPAWSSLNGGTARLNPAWSPPPSSDSLRGGGEGPAQELQDAGGRDELLGPVGQPLVGHVGVGRQDPAQWMVMSRAGSGGMTSRPSRDDRRRRRGRRQRAKPSRAARISLRMVSLPVCPESSTTTSRASGQAWASSHAVTSGPPRSKRPWMSTPGMPASL